MGEPLGVSNLWYWGNAESCFLDWEKLSNWLLQSHSSYLLYEMVLWLTREVTDSPSLEVFRNCLDMILDNLLAGSAWAGGWTRKYPEGRSENIHLPGLGMWHVPPSCVDWVTLLIYITSQSWHFVRMSHLSMFSTEVKSEGHHWMRNPLFQDKFFLQGTSQGRNCPYGLPALLYYYHM